jgi:hypothetical protein
VVRQGHCIAVVVAFLIGSAAVLMAGASGVQEQASKKEEARCEGTITTNNPVPGSGGGPYTTNDLPGELYRRAHRTGAMRTSENSYSTHSGE